MKQARSLYELNLIVQPIKLPSPHHLKPATFHVFKDKVIVKLIPSLLKKKTSMCTHEKRGLNSTLTH